MMRMWIIWELCLHKELHSPFGVMHHLRFPGSGAIRQTQVTQISQIVVSVARERKASQRNKNQQWKKDENVLKK